jgi:phosphonate transport system substrate-binding protein
LFLASSRVLAAPFVHVHAPSAIRFALTPVFLDNDADVISALQSTLSERIGRDVDLVQRRTYQKITGALLNGSVDAAWTCGYPFLQHEAEQSLPGVPVWNGQPLYQSYLTAAADDPAQDLGGLRDGTHAFSDPDSSSGILVTASDLAGFRLVSIKSIHCAGWPQLAVKIRQHSHATDFLRQIVMQVSQRMADEVHVGQA